MVRIGLSTPRDDGLRDAAGLGAARPLLDGMALPRGAWGGGLDEARRACADVAQAIVAVRAGDDDRPARAGRDGFALLRAGYHGSADGPRRQLDPRHRPSFLLGAGGELAGVDWQFNGWGEYQPDHAQDAQMAARDPRACRCAPLRRRPRARGRRDPGRRGGHLPRRRRPAARPASAIPGAAATRSKPN